MPRGESSPILRLCLIILHVGSRLVPAPERRDWMREWEAEVRGRCRELAERGALTAGACVDLVWRALGAFKDAASLRRNASLDLAIGRDLRYAWRFAWRNPGFSATASIVLALGIGATTAIFS